MEVGQLDEVPDVGERGRDYGGLGDGGGGGRWGCHFWGWGVCGVGVWGDRLGSGKKGLGMERLWNGMVKLCICRGDFDRELSFGEGIKNTKL